MPSETCSECGQPIEDESENYPGMCRACGIETAVGILSDELL